MYVYVWEFEVGADRREAFEAAYGPGGEWARLFARADAYLGTDLLHDRERAERYLTVDRWRSATARQAFGVERRAEIAALDTRCAELTSAERLLGEFDLAEPPKGTP